MELVNKLYVGLGVPSIVSTTPYSDWYCYTPNNNTWEQKAEFPGGRAQAWSFSVGSDVYVGGGVDNTNYTFPVSSTSGYGSYTLKATYAAFYYGGTYTNNRFSANDIALGDYQLSWNSFSGGAWLGGFMYAGFASIISKDTHKCLGYDGLNPILVTDDIQEYKSGLMFPMYTTPYTLFTLSAYKYANLSDAQNAYNSIYISASTTNTVTKQFKDLWKYNALSNDWAKVPNQPATISEAAWSKSTGFAIGSYGFIINEETGESYKYLPFNNTWNKIASYPGGGRRYLNKFVIGTIPYVGGGATGSDYSKAWYSYNYISDSWSSIATYTGTSRTGAYAFSASGIGYVVGGYNGTYLNSGYAYIPSINGWTTIPNTGTSSFFGVGLSTPDAGYAMLGVNGGAVLNSNNKFTGSWQNKTSFIGTSRLFSTAEGVSLNSYNNYIYYTTGSMSVCPTLCNLWAIKVTNFDDVYPPTVIGAIPISTNTYWKAPTTIPAKYNNSYYPMDIVANNNYVIVTQWHYPTGSNDIASGSNFINIGIRASSSTPFISTWYPQTLYYDQNHSYMFPPGITFRSNTASGSFYAHGINDIIIKDCIVNTETVGTIPHLVFSNYTELNFVATQYNVASYGVKNALGRNSDISKIDGNLLYITPTAFPLSVSQKYPANTTIIDDTTNTETLINNSLYWTQRIKDGE